MTNQKQRVLALPGDGIGSEVMASAIAVAEHASIDWTVEIDDTVNSQRWLDTGIAIDDTLIDKLRDGAYDAILFGAVGSPHAPEGVVERQTLLRLRKDLDLAINHRPVRLPPGVDSPLTSGARIDADVVRENTEGGYVGIDGGVHADTDAETAVTVSISTRHGIERAARYAFDLAAPRGRNVTLVHKANVLQAEGALWRKTVERVALDYEGVTHNYLHGDVAAMRFVTHPETFDVVVTDNLFGDLLTDLGAALAGGLGLASSMNLNPSTGLALFEPVHGSAPDIAGQGIANPLAMVRCLALCAAHLGHTDAAARIHRGCDRAASSNSTTTTAFTDAVIAGLDPDQ